MKPHEQALTVMQFDKERRCIVEGGSKMVAVLRNYDSAEWEQFLTAAPEMARALLASGRIDPNYPDSAWHTHECWDNGKASCEEQCTLTRAALDKAGVLP